MPSANRAPPGNQDLLARHAVVHAKDLPVLREEALPRPCPAVQTSALVRPEGVPVHSAPASLPSLPPPAHQLTQRVLSPSAQTPCPVATKTPHCGDLRGFLATPPRPGKQPQTSLRSGLWNQKHLGFEFLHCVPWGKLLNLSELHLQVERDGHSCVTGLL